MQAFKLYFKILKKTALMPILLFVIIFAMLTVTFSQTSSKTNEFELTKCKVAVIDYDKSILSKELTKYIGEKAKLVTVENDENSIKDALFFREIDYIATIPASFGASFEQNNMLTIESMQIPDSTNAKLVSNLIDSYLNTAKIYLDATGKIEYQAVKEDLSISTKVDVVVENKAKTSSTSLYLNYFSFTMLSIMILAISMIMTSVNEINVKRRYLASPQKTSPFTLKMLTANMILMLAIVLVFAIISIVMYSDVVFSTRGILWLVNVLSFSTFALCFGFFISNLASKASAWAISNCVSMSLGFLGGAFVPQEMLSESILKFGVINPVYWFVKANNTIDSLNTFNTETLNPVILSVSILLGFACAFAAMTLVVMKYKRRSN